MVIAKNNHLRSTAHAGERAEIGKSRKGRNVRQQELSLNIRAAGPGEVMHWRCVDCGLGLVDRTMESPGGRAVIRWHIREVHGKEPKDYPELLERQQRQFRIREEKMVATQAAKQVKKMEGEGHKKVEWFQTVVVWSQKPRIRKDLSLKC